MTNEERRLTAETAIQAHQRAHDSLNDLSSREELVGLLTDLRHWADHVGVDFTDIVTISAGQFETETTDDSDTAEVQLFRETPSMGDREYFDIGDDDIDNRLQQLIDDTIVQTRIDNVTRRVGFEIG